MRAALDRAKASFPPGLDYSISYDSTRFITSSIEEVTHTLFEAPADYKIDDAATGLPRGQAKQ